MPAAFLLSHNPELAWAHQKKRLEIPCKDNGVQSKALQGSLLDRTFKGQP